MAQARWMGIPMAKGLELAEVCSIGAAVEFSWAAGEAVIVREHLELLELLENGRDGQLAVW